MGGGGRGGLQKLSTVMIKKLNLNLQCFKGGMLQSGFWWTIIDYDHGKRYLAITILISQQADQLIRIRKFY